MEEKKQKKTTKMNHLNNILKHSIYCLTRLLTNCKAVTSILCQKQMNTYFLSCQNLLNGNMFSRHNGVIAIKVSEPAIVSDIHGKCKHGLFYSDLMQN